MKNQYILPPGPSSHPFFQMRKFIRDPIQFFETCRNQYGKTFTLKLLGQPRCVVISDPADLKQVFMASSDQLHAGEINATVFEPILGKESLLTLDGKKHLQHRKLLLPPFHGERMQVYGEIMAKIARKKIISWKKDASLRIFDEARDITFSIILSAIFGMDEESTRFAKLEKSLHALIHVIKKPFGLMTLLNKSLHINLGPLTPWAKMMQLRHQVDICLFEEIAARKKMILTDRIDMLSLLLQARDEAGNPMTDQEIRDEMITLLIAGHETSTTGISWALYGILSNQEILRKIKAELHQGIAHVDKWVYLDAIVKEALRVTPVVPYITRLTQETYTLGKYILPKGTMIMPSIYLAHHDPLSWDAPELFRPERFLNVTEMPYTYLPFGGGMRRCIGAAFAQYEMKIVIAQVLLHAELVLKKNYVPKLVRQGVVIVPSDGVPVLNVSNTF